MQRSPRRSPLTSSIVPRSCSSRRHSQSWLSQEERYGKALFGLSTESQRFPAEKSKVAREIKSVRCHETQSRLSRFIFSSLSYALNTEPHINPLFISETFLSISVSILLSYYTFLLYANCKFAFTNCKDGLAPSEPAEAMGLPKGARVV